MNCPSCNSALEANARFCGVCGYRLQSQPAPRPAAPAASAGQGQPSVQRAGAPIAPAGQAGSQGTPKPRPAATKPKPKPEDPYINQTLNNRFKIESKIGEGGFGAVYRGVQLATGRKVALKLLHPEMTKDENLVARFKREGMVLCNLRDAHTITTYDFDRTPDGTLYIAMELLEGKSLHQLFHEQAPLDWRRMFKILTEMCSSLAEAHAQGIVHRDLKPENVYLETRPGNPEFVKILDFGIAKVMRGDSIDPASPQLTATGQTLGTLEYMSPEQLMGKQLDGRSDVYALGVVAYEMITGRLPFPDAKGPAGLITAQLKQTPIPPSQANPKAALPPTADRVILKCLEKEKNNRYADVSQLAVALQEVLATTSNSPGLSNAAHRLPAPELLETRRGDPPPAAGPPAMPSIAKPPAPAPAPMINNAPTDGFAQPRAATPAPPYPDPYHHQRAMTPPSGAPLYPQPHIGSNQHNNPQALAYAQTTPQPNLPPLPAGHSYPQYQPPAHSSKRWLWWGLAFIALGSVIGLVVAIVV